MSGDKPGPLSRHWKGGSYKNDQGYVFICYPDHPRATRKNSHRNGYVREHILIAEKALGKYLPEQSSVHHVDGNPANNQPSNLVICENHGYHKLLHYRTRAYKACGHANWYKCEVCGQYDAPENMYVRKGRMGAYHNKCVNEYQKKMRNNK